jgi:hypothetical protein
VNLKPTNTAIKASQTLFSPFEGGSRGMFFTGQQIHHELASFKAGKRLADLHLNYEHAPEYKLEWIVAKDKPLDYRVEKMRLNKDKTELKVNDTLTLAGIPPETYRYSLGNRSALEWVIDQYQVKTDKRSGITTIAFIQACSDDPSRVAIPPSVADEDS